MFRPNSIWQFATAANIRFGRGSLELLPQELQRLHVTRPLIVTDQTIAALPAVVSLLQTLQKSFSAVVVFDGCVPEPPIEIAHSAIALGLSEETDSVVAIGGGSNLDIGKIAATVLKLSLIHI